MTDRWGIALLAVGLLSGSTVYAADKQAEALQKTVVEAGEKFAKAFAQQDAKAIAALFTEEAEYVDEAGTVFHGRGAIEDEFTADFAAAPAGSIALELLSIRPIAEGVVVEEGVTTFTPKEDGQTRHTRYTATHVRQKNGSWLLASVRELEAGAMTPHERLKALGWLIGTWHEEVDGTTISTKWDWSEDGNFLLSEFTIRRTGETVAQGTHRVGWDAERQQFRSWVFRATGAAGEGWWRVNEDGSWTVNLTVIDVSGVRSSSLVTYERDGRDTLVVTQAQIVHGGESLPGSSHRVVRQPPQPQSAAKKK